MQCDFTHDFERCGYCAKRNLLCGPKYPTPRKCREAGIAVPVLSTFGQRQTTQQPSVAFPQPPQPLRVEIPQLPPQFTVTSARADDDDDDDDGLLDSPTPSPSPSPIISAGGYFVQSPATGLSPTGARFANLQISSPHLDSMTLQLPPSPIALPLSPSGTTTPEYFSAPASPMIPATEPLAVDKSHMPRSPVPIPPLRHPDHTLNSSLGAISPQIPDIHEYVVDGQTYTQDEIWNDVENFLVEYNPCMQSLANLAKEGHPKFSRIFQIPGCLRRRNPAGNWGTTVAS